jgi:L-amino acid N-acyltransferase YncA
VAEGSILTEAIRPASAADLAAVVAIYAHYVETSTATFEETVPTRAEMELRWRAVVERGLPFFVAARDGDVVGYAYAALFRQRTAYRFTVEDSIYVRADFGGRGLGRRLLRAVIADCTAGGYRQMVAVIGDSANAASIRLHTSLDFRPVGLLPSTGFKFGRWIDSVYMQRPLGDGDTGSPDG